MKKRGFTSTELARRANVLTSFLYDIISGKSSNPSTVKLARVSEALGISLNYLVSGTDENYRASTQVENNSNYICLSQVVTGDNFKDCMVSSRIIENEPFYFNKSWIKNHLNADSSNIKIFTINGDSMGPTLMHQDIVLVDTSKCVPSPPSIFVIYDGFGVTCKRLEYCGESKGNLVRVISDNNHYSVYECSISDLTIIGRVVWFSRKM